MYTLDTEAGKVNNSVNLPLCECTFWAFRPTSIKAKNHPAKFRRGCLLLIYWFYTGVFEPSLKQNSIVPSAFTIALSRKITYLLTNNNQNIRSIRLRIEELEKLRELDFEPVGFETGKVIVNKEINRIQFFFDGKPDEETRGVLKSWGVHFSRYNNNAWQRQLNSNGIYAAKKVLEKLDEINQSEEQDIDEGPTLGM